MATAQRISVIDLEGISRVLSQNYGILCKFEQRLSGDAYQASSGELRALLQFMASGSQPAWGHYTVVPEEGVEPTRY